MQPTAPGLDRKLSRQGSRAHTAHTDMGTLRRGEAPNDTGMGRDPGMRGSGALRQAGGYYSGYPGGYPAGGPPGSAAQYATRPSSRPASSAFGQLPSPRQHNSSYRDAALVASQHGLSAYVPPARKLASRSGQHPPPVYTNGVGYQSNLHASGPQSYYQPLGSERLPSRGGQYPPPSRNGLHQHHPHQPPSRSGPPPSRGGPPPPPSPGKSAGGDNVVLTVTHNDAGWKNLEQLHDSGHPYPSSVAAAMRGLGAGWGPGAPPGGPLGPSVYEVDGRPGTRGGGPQYDMEGRPTTRGGQRPPSRAQLGLVAPPPKPGHVPPLGSASPLSSSSGWGSMFASGPVLPAVGASGGHGGTAAASSSNSSGAPAAAGELTSSGRRQVPALKLGGGPLVNGGLGVGVLSGLAGHPSGGSGGGGLGGTGRLVNKLSSIAEVPGSPAAASPKSRLDSAGGGGSGSSARKPRERERDLLSSAPDGMDAFLDGVSEEVRDLAVLVLHSSLASVRKLAARQETTGGRLAQIPVPFCTLSLGNAANGSAAGI